MPVRGRARAWLALHSVLLAGSALLAILRDVAERQPLLLRRPEPVALFTGFGESSLDFSLRFWTVAGDTWGAVRSAALVEIHGELAKAGIEVPFPQREPHVKSVAPEALRELGGGGARGVATDTQSRSAAASTPPRDLETGTARSAETSTARSAEAYAPTRA